MKTLLLLNLLIFTLSCAQLTSGSNEIAPSCLPHLQEGLCLAPIEQLKVTQANVGMVAVWERVERLERAYSRGRLHHYLNQRPAPAVVGPEGHFYIIDRHHLSRALQLAIVPEQDKVLYLTIIENFSEMTTDQFWETMTERSWVLLFERGRPIRPEQLPVNVRGLSDDPYRSLARYAQRAGKFEKTTEPFLEFRFAQKYREHLNIPDEQMPTTIQGLRQLIPQL